MESETFKMRKQFLEEFYNEDRIKFLNACEKIYIKDANFNTVYNSVCVLETEPVFRLDINNMFKTFCNLLKPFVYFLYSVTRYTKFLHNKPLFFGKLEIRYSKDNISRDEIGRSTVYFDFSNSVIYSEDEDLNSLKSIKIKDFLNDSIKGLTCLNIVLKTKYLNVNRSQYRILRGIEDVLNNVEDIEETTYEEEKEKVINPYLTFKSAECVICLTNSPDVLFCNCGHIPICSECEHLKEFKTCPICKTENDNIRILEE